MSRGGPSGRTERRDTCGAKIASPRCSPASARCRSTYPGPVSNQGRLYPHFDAVVLLSAPTEVLLRRIESRTTNVYGKAAGERELILERLAEVEPLLRATCTHEIDATQSVDDVVAALVAIGSDPPRAPSPEAR
jgi:hypothetical protein